MVVDEIVGLTQTQPIARVCQNRISNCASGISPDQNVSRIVCISVILAKQFDVETHHALDTGQTVRHSPRDGIEFHRESCFN